MKTLQQKLKQKSYIKTHKWIQKKINNETNLTWDEIVEKTSFSKYDIPTLLLKYFKI